MTKKQSDDLRRTKVVFSHNQAMYHLKSQKVGFDRNIEAQTDKIYF